MAAAAGMARSTFSLFRVVERHPVAGIRLDGLLHSRRVWLVDRSLKRTAVNGIVLGLRLFDAGPFHVALGPVVQPAEQEVEEALWMQQTAGRPCFREPLAARLYRLDIQVRLHRAALGISADGRT